MHNTQISCSIFFNLPCVLKVRAMFHKIQLIKKWFSHEYRSAGNKFCAYLKVSISISRGYRIKKTSDKNFFKPLEVKFFPSKYVFASLNKICFCLRYNFRQPIGVMYQSLVITNCLPFLSLLKKKELCETWSELKWIIQYRFMFVWKKKLIQTGEDI